jgi:DNA-binding transcriptional regulator GbsR (MarR family)
MDTNQQLPLVSADPYDLAYSERVGTSYGKLSQSTTLQNLNTTPQNSSDTLPNINTNNNVSSTPSNISNTNRPLTQQQSTETLPKVAEEKTNFQILQTSLNRILGCTTRLITSIEPFLESLSSDSNTSKLTESATELKPQLERAKKLVESIREKTEGLQEERGT